MLEQGQEAEAEKLKRKKIKSLRVQTAVSQELLMAMVCYSLLLNN